MTKNQTPTTMPTIAEEEMVQVAVVLVEEVMVAEDEAVAIAEEDEATDLEGMQCWIAITVANVVV